MSEPPRDRSTSSQRASDRIQIRNLVLTDVVLAAALHVLCFEDRPWKADTFADLLATPGTFGLLAHGEQEPYGFLLCRAVAEECEILTLAVAPPWRRHGVARDLLQAGFRRAAEHRAQTLFLEVAVDNKPAVDLYRGMGFAQVAVRPGYYRRTEPPRQVDALVMSRPLHGDFRR